MLERTSSNPHRESDFPRLDLSNWTHIWMDSHSFADRFCVCGFHHAYEYEDMCVFFTRDRIDLFFRDDDA